MPGPNDVHEHKNSTQTHQEEERAKYQAVQAKTFTRWVNSHLKDKKMSIPDLQTGLCNGLALIVRVFDVCWPSLSGALHDRLAASVDGLGVCVRLSVRIC